MKYQPSTGGAFSRRDFLKLAALGTDVLAFHSSRPMLPESPQGKQLGRIAVGKMNVYSSPNANSQVIGTLYEEHVVQWTREVVGSLPGRVNHRFVETPEGYILGGKVQHVRNHSNSPVAKLLQTSLGAGMWVEVTIPYVDLILQNSPCTRAMVAVSALHQPATSPV